MGRGPNAPRSRERGPGQAVHASRSRERGPDRKRRRIAKVIKQVVRDFLRMERSRERGKDRKRRRGRSQERGPDAAKRARRSRERGAGKGKGVGGLPRGKEGRDIRAAWIRMKECRARAKQKRKEGVKGRLGKTITTWSLYYCPPYGRQVEGQGRMKYKTVSSGPARRRIEAAAQKARKKVQKRIDDGYVIRWRPPPVDV